MDKALVSLVLAMAAFVGSHFLLSHPLRAQLVRAWGRKPFQAVYSLVSIVTLAWVAIAFHRAAPAPVLWNGQAAVPWIIACVLTFAAMALFLASLTGNPALPGARVAGLSAIMPKGVYKITRHPMMFAFALWALAHLLVAPTLRGLVLTGGIALLAIGGSWMQDRKKDALHGRDWRAWMKRTSFWPDLTRLGKLGAYWGIAALPWLFVTWLHMPLAHVPAGVWLWIEAANQ